MWWQTVEHNWETNTLTFLHVYINPLRLESPSNPNPHSILLDHLCGERNGNPLQFSCLENSVDRGVWWAAVLGVAQSWTWLKRLSMHACIGEGNGNPLQCSCLENPRDGGAWWAAVSGVAQRQTRPKQLSSSSSSSRSSLSWAPCVIQKLPTSYLFYTWYYIHVNCILSIRPLLPFPPVSTSPFSMSVPLFLPCK